MKAMKVMSALSQATRLEVFRRLVDAPNGMAAGDIAAATNASPNTMSAHLAILSRVGLVTSVRTGRSIVYRAETAPVANLAEFLRDLCTPGTISEAEGNAVFRA